MATTLARKAWYELRDFFNAKDQGVEGFSLLIERKVVCHQEQWWGTFENGNKTLKIIATLEKN
jgi:hypothetical protein